MTLWVWDLKETEYDWSGRRTEPESQPPANSRSVAPVPSRIPLEKEASHELLGGLHHDEGGSLPIH